MTKQLELAVFAAGGTTRHLLPESGRVTLGRAEGNDPTPADTPDVVDAPLEILRMVLPAVDNDDVFQPAADKKLAVGQIPKINQLLNGIVWAANLEVPSDGVQCTIPESIQPPPAPARGGREGAPSATGGQN